jgi:hypothetical protein
MCPYSNNTSVFGMSLDLAAVLSVYAAIMSGDIVSLSIGGKPKSGGLLGGLGSALGLLGEPQGLSWSHGRFEIDSSPTRADLFVTGDPVSVDLSHIEEIMALPKGPNGIDLSALVPYRVARLKETIATNGRFFQGPFGQLTLNAAVYFFTYRYFANHTADNLEGYLSEETLKSFEGVTGEKGSYQWASGQERIPENVSAFCLLLFCASADIHHSGTAAPSATNTVLRVSLSTPRPQFSSTPN